MQPIVKWRLRLWLGGSEPAIMLHRLSQIARNPRVIICPGQNHDLAEIPHMDLKFSQNTICVVKYDSVIQQAHMTHDARTSISEHIHIIAQARPCLFGNYHLRT